jgi:hypothetical protein
MFLEDVPLDFLADSVAMLQYLYPEAYRTTYDRFGFPEAHDALGVDRRAMVEGAIRELAGRYPQIQARVLKNHRKTQNYTELRCGRVVITISCLHYPQSRLRPAEFRAQRTLSMQRSISQIQPDLVSETVTVFAVLAHGPKSDTPPHLDWQNLGFAFAGFPTEDCLHWQAQIELMNSFRRSTEADGVEVIEDRTMPIIRRNDADTKHGTE